MNKYHYFICYNTYEGGISNCNLDLDYEITSIDHVEEIEKTIARSFGVSDVAMMGWQLLRKDV